MGTRAQMTSASPDLRGYLEQVRRQHPEEIVEVDQPVSPEYELTAYWQEYLNKGSPILSFTNLKGYQGRLIINVFGTRKRVARMLGATEEGIYETWTNRMQSPRDPVNVSDGPVKEEKMLGSAVDATRFPIPKYFADDAGSYVIGVVVANDPEDGIHNLSYARMQLKDKNKFGISMHSRGYLWMYHQKAIKKGLPHLNVAVIVGCNPLVYLTAATRTRNEYSLVGSMTGEPVELVKCETSDVYVPANAEIVLEGRILTGATEAEGPFSEYTGYMSGRSTKNVLLVDAITHRHDAIFQGVIPSNSAEHLLLAGIPKQATVYRKVKAAIPQVRKINWPLWGTAYVAIMSVDKKGKEGVQVRAGMHLMAEDYYLKYVIVVDDDIDVFDETSVFWAMATRSQPVEDLHLIRLGDGNILDPSQPVAGVTSRVIIDASKPEGWTFERPRLPDDVVSRIKRMIR